MLRALVIGLTSLLLISALFAGCRSTAGLHGDHDSEVSKVMSNGAGQFNARALNSCDIDIRPRARRSPPGKRLLVQYEAQDNLTKLWITSDSNAQVWDEKETSHGRVPSDDVMVITVLWQGAQFEAVTVTSVVGGTTKPSPDIPTKGTYRPDEPISSPSFEQEGINVWNVVRVQNRGRSTILRFIM